MLDNVAIIGAFLPVITDPPVLEITMNGGDMVFNWTADGFKVQSRTNLVDGIWQDVTNGNTPPVTNYATDSQCFFRLIEQ